MLIYSQRHRLLTGLLAASLLSSLSGTCRLFAQADDPFGAAASGKPAAGGNVPLPKKGEPSILTEERNPIVLTIRDSNPATPEALMKAVQTLSDIGRLDEAQKYLEKLIALKLDTNGLANLHAKLGSESFSRLMTQKRLGEAGAAFGSAVLAAAAKAARDPDQINRLIAKLTDPNEDIRLASARALLAARQDAIGALLRALANDARADEHRAVQQALFRLGEEALEPLIAVFESDDDNLKSRIIPILGALQSSRPTQYLLRPYLSPNGKEPLRQAAAAALEHLLGNLPSQIAAEQYLNKRVNEYVSGTIPVPVDSAGFGTLWHWDSTQKIPTPRRYHFRDLTAVEAARIANELYLLAPDKLDVRRQFFVTRFEAEKFIGGIGRPLSRGKGTTFEIAKEAGVEFMEDLLVHVHKLKRIPAIVSCLEVLGEIAKPSILASTDGAPRPISRMLGHADRRVRFAAAQAILQIDPQQSFVGASRITETFGFFAGSAGSRRVLIGHPDTIEAQSLVGMLNELGYEADSAQSGRAFFQLAATRPDYELLLLSDRLNHPRPMELVQMLRQEPRTAGQVVALLAWPQIVKIPEGIGKLPEDELQAMLNKRSPRTVANRPITGGAAAASNNAPQNKAGEYQVPFGKTKVDLLGVKANRMTPIPAPSQEPELRDDLEHWRQVLATDPMADAFLKPNTAEELQYILQQLMDRGGRHIVGREERLRHADAALEAFVKFSENDHQYAFYEARTQQSPIETALRTPELSAKAAKVLGNFGTPKAQQLLLDFASDRGQPLSARKAAAAAFKEGVKRRGLLITRSAVLAQYERYNFSRVQDKETQELLSSLLDVIEKKAD